MPPVEDRLVDFPTLCATDMPVSASDIEPFTLVSTQDLLTRGFEATICDTLPKNHRQSVMRDKSTAGSTRFDSFRIHRFRDFCSA
jgi:hypothetical protein